MSELKENDFPPLEPQPFVTEEGQEIERLRAELAAAKALNKAWEQKAATWLATPEAAARLQSYRDLGQQVAQAQNESDALLFQLCEMQKQRDEARRDACAFEAINRWNIAHPKGIISECAVVRISREIAVERGWDCFKEGGGA